MAGLSDTGLFDSAAIAAIARASRGIPRLINILAHKALMLGFGEGLQRIGRRQALGAIRDTEDASKPIWPNWLPVLSLSCLMAAAMGLWWRGGGL